MIKYTAFKQQALHFFKLQALLTFFAPQAQDRGVKSKGSAGSAGGAEGAAIQGGLSEEESKSVKSTEIAATSTDDSILKLNLFENTYHLTFWNLFYPLFVLAQLVGE